MLRQVLAPLLAIGLLFLTGCVTTADRLVSVQGELVDAAGAAVEGCELALMEKSSSADRYVARRRVGGKFSAEFTSWAPSYSSLEVAINCPNHEPFLSKPHPVSSLGRNGIDLGRILLKKR